MPIIAETHSHTLASAHAYSTIYENVREASRLGLKFLCLTDHAPAMEDAPHQWYFKNMPKVVPDVIDGVVVLKGAEANIMDHRGTLDLPDGILSRLDWVIASYHDVCIRPGSVEDHTAGWLAVAENPLVDVIGHCGNEKFRFDLDAVIPAFARHGKIVEINAHSFGVRPHSKENCAEVARRCKRYGVPVVCSSDAHFFTEIGRCQPSLDLLRSVDFPEELILNLDYERFLAVARQKSGRPLV